MDIGLILGNISKNHSADIHTCRLEAFGWWQIVSRQTTHTITLTL